MVSCLLVEQGISFVDASLEEPRRTLLDLLGKHFPPRGEFGLELSSS